MQLYAQKRPFNGCLFPLITIKPVEIMQLKMGDFRLYFKPHQAPVRERGRCYWRLDVLHVNRIC